jgi:AraC family transcriptional regulator, transcriptional activator FtrA
VSAGRPLRKRPVTSRGRAKHVIGVVVVPDSMPLELLVTQSIFGPPVRPIAEIMGVAEDSPYDVVLYGEKRRYLLPGGIDMGELTPLDTLPEVDTVIAPGIAEPMAPRSERLLQSLRAASDSGARMVSFCGGAFVLAQAGLLDGRTATTHWLLAPEFRDLYPRVHLEVDRLYVDDPPVHTSGGIFAATDLALHLIALDQGQAVANEISRLLVSAPHRSGGQAQFINYSMRADGDTPMESLLDWLRDNLHEPLTLADLARHEHMSERSLVRKFRAATGMSVFDWIARERVGKAKVLLETSDFAVSEVAAMAGFGSSETLRRNFEKAVGTTAGAYRRTFRKGA